MSDGIAYCRRAFAYCAQVVGGEIVTGQLMRLACQRQLDDLGRADWTYEFDTAAAGRACAFLETLPHIEGEYAARGELLKLQPWQLFLVTTLFGWRDRETGRRRFRSCYWEVARKNGKSFLASGLALYMLIADDEAGAQVFTAATKRDQAKVVFDLARSMVLACKESGTSWAREVGVHAHSLFVSGTSSKMRALDAQGKRQDGLNPHAVINDEVHAWEKRALYDVLKSAMGARAQPLMINITTAGFNFAGVCYALRGYAVRILKGAIADDSVFPAIWTLDEADDPWDTANWPKANPNWNVSVYPLAMEAEARTAKEIPSEQNGFLTKRLNVWCNAEACWMDMLRWQQCADPALRIEDFAGEYCWLGVDLASKRDLSSLVAIFADTVGGKRHWYQFARHYLPEHAARNSPNSGHYDGWIRSGHLLTTPGAILDVDRIEADTLEWGRLFRVRELGFDPGHNATQYGVHMAGRGFTVVEVRPTVLNFSDPMKYWDANVRDGTWHHNGDPVMTWMVSNVMVRSTGTATDCIFPRKEHDDRKIDGAVATIIAFNRALLGAQESVYDHRGVITV